MSGKLEPGSKLRFADLVKNYEAGVSTFRASLSRLTADRWSLPRASVAFGFRRSPSTSLWDITKLRADIESAALEESIEAGGDAWEAEIVSCLHRLLKLEKRDAKTPLLLTEEGAHLHKLFQMSLLAACPKHALVLGFGVAGACISVRARRRGALCHISVPCHCPHPL